MVSVGEQDSLGPRSLPVQTDDGFSGEKEKEVPLGAGVKVNAITDALRGTACWESFRERVPGRYQPLAWAR
ncbi:Uncharacterized protein DAT39_018917 [Clarias magur]|uniref:Uncharacterized protein n=1 Tax=Clarias magur TaxID=1594786 RepID=A0A8J4WUB5_CLAMG|nr:Uncharacterized protein DAT39_018917 [Clarias magur]